MTTEEKNTRDAQAGAEGTGPAPIGLDTQIVKGVLIAVIAAAVVVPLALVAVPYIEFFNDMAVQPRARPLGVYGRDHGLRIPVERAPAPGTIARDAFPYPYQGNDPAAAEKAGNELSNPFKGTMAVLIRGRTVFSTFCYPCHGALGQGDGPVVGPGRFPAPANLTSAAVKDYPDGRIFHVITKGQNVMPSYEDTIPPDDRWKAVWFVRVLRRTIDGASPEARQ